LRERLKRKWYELRSAIRATDRTASSQRSINAAAACGTSVRIDDETEALVDYAKACFAKSNGAFDVTSGILRFAWDFSRSRPPSQASIDALLPRIGLDKVTVSDGYLHFAQAGMELDFGGLGKEYAADRAAEVCAGLGREAWFY
jgi:FAD:protein FMN transferase